MGNRLASVAVFLCLALVGCTRGRGGTTATCGDGVCDSSETASCPADCACDGGACDASDTANDPPADVPVEQPTDVPVEPPTDTPIDRPADVPTDPPSDLPSDAPSEVPATCGNGRIDPGESCDGTALGTGTCTNIFGGTGTLGCNPDCTYGSAACLLPDMVVYASEISTSCRITNNYTPNSCEATLGCATGPGPRRILEFNLVSENVGAATIHFGSPSSIRAPYTGLWEPNGCGGLAFRNYAAYWICPTGIDCATAPMSARLTTGHKESFCFIENYPSAPDYVCPGGICPTCGGIYSCGNMGQRPGCADNYYRGLDCQWIDVTGLATGTYTLCVHIDPTDRIYETRDDNNISCVPVTIPAGTGTSCR